MDILSDMVNLGISYYIMLFAYIVGIVISVSFVTRDPTTKDVWLGVIWPLIIMKTLVIVVLISLHEIFRFLCLLLNADYKKSSCYIRIDSFLHHF